VPAAETFLQVKDPKALDAAVRRSGLKPIWLAGQLGITRQRLWMMRSRPGQRIAAPTATKLAQILNVADPASLFELADAELLAPFVQGIRS